MKILFICGTLQSGGAERVISILANQLSKDGNVVEIMTYFDEEVWYDIDKDVKIICEEKEINKRGKAILSHLLWKRNYIKNSKPDVVISFLAVFNMITIVSMLGISIPLIVADRSDPRYAPLNKIIRRMRDFLYRFADKVVLQSENNKAYFKDAIKRKSIIIMNPIEDNPMLQKALTTPKKNKIVMVGRVIKEKNPYMAVKAFQLFHDNHPEYILEIYGDGDLKDRMIEETKRLGLEKCIFYKGRVKNIYERIVDAEAFILTSNYEGMPNALIEAMYVGLPVISTKVSGAIDLIEDGENGYLVECNDSNKMALYLENIILNNEKHSEMGLKASESVKILTADKTIEQWKDIVNEIIKKES